MTRASMRKRLRQEGGFALIEVLVSALIVALVTGAVIELLDSTGRAGAEERHHSQAYAIAQEDQARLRSMQIASLQRELPARTVTLNGTPYEVSSSASFVSEKTGTTQCGSEARADYIRVASAVTWPTMREGAEPVTIESIDSPVSGSIDPTAGTLVVTVTSPPLKTGEPAIPVSGAGLTGSGPATFSGSTNSEGCAIFGREPAGRYTITPRLGSEYVEQDGNAPPTIPVSIVGGGTTNLPLEYGKKGTIEASFTVRASPSSSEVRPASADSIVLSATGMSSPRQFGTPGGARTPTVKAESLFPFSYTYNIYAGSCTSNKTEAGSANVQAPAGGEPASAVIQLPALYLNVYSSKEKRSISGAKVTLTDPNCEVGERPLKRTYTTGEAGGLTEPGVPFGTYELCASAKIGGTPMRLKVPKLEVHSIEGNSPPLTLDLSGGEKGECP